MGIPLEKIMKIPPFSNAVLVGGKKGIGRIVESANIQEVPHVERWLHGGEIVFLQDIHLEGVRKLLVTFLSD